MSARDQVCETSQAKKEKTMARLRSSTARSMGRKSSQESSSSRLDGPDERILLAACAAADGAEKAAENAEIAAQAAEQAAEQALVAGKVAGQAIAASAWLRQEVAQSHQVNKVGQSSSSHQGSQKVNQSPRIRGIDSSTNMLEEDGRPKRCGPNTTGPKA